jgi:hypothetical protein
MDDATLEQVSKQCRAVAALARNLAEVHEDYAGLFGPGSPSTIADMVGRRTAAFMETLGDMLNGMDAVDENHAWMTPVFAEAHRRWPVPPAKSDAHSPSEASAGNRATDEDEAPSVLAHDGEG